MATELTKPEELEEETETRRRMDPELRSMSAILRMLDDLEPAARGRVVAYLASRYKETS